jgi:hypothetical protein
LVETLPRQRLPVAQVAVDAGRTGGPSRGQHEIASGRGDPLGREAALAELALQPLDHSQDVVGSARHIRQRQEVALERDRSRCRCETRRVAGRPPSTTPRVATDAGIQRVVAHAVGIGCSLRDLWSAVED